MMWKVSLHEGVTGKSLLHFWLWGVFKENSDATQHTYICMQTFSVD